MTDGGRPRHRRLVALLALLIVVVPLVVFLWGRGSSAFAVERVRLSGARRVSAVAAARALRARFLGHNLFTVRPADVTAALRSFPYVDHVEIDRDFPGTLRVRILEYRPAAVLFAEGHWYVVSREGHVLRRLPGEVPPPAPAATSDGGQSGVGGGSAAKASSSTGDEPSANDAGHTASPAAASGSMSAASSGASSAAATQSSATPAAPSGTGDAAPAVSADDVAAATAAALSSSALSAPVTPSLFDGDLTAATLSGVTVPSQAGRMPLLATTSAVKVGETVEDRSVQDALGVLAALPRARRARVRYVSVDPAGILVVLRDGVTFAFGDAQGLSTKVLALRAVLAAYARHHLRATWVDVSVPNRPLGTPVIVSGVAPLQTARAHAKPTPSPSPSPGGSGTKASPVVKGSVSPAGGASTSISSPRPSTGRTAPPSASPSSSPTNSGGGAAG